MPYAAISYRVKPGFEDEIAEIFSRFQRVNRPEYKGEQGEEQAGKLLGTAVFIQGDVVVRFIHFEGDFAGIGKHMGAQKGVHLIEDALAPYLAEQRDTSTEEGWAAHFRSATMRCISQLSVDTLKVGG